MIDFSVIIEKDNGRSRHGALTSLPPFVKYEDAQLLVAFGRNVSDVVVADGRARAVVRPKRR